MASKPEEAELSPEPEERQFATLTMPGGQVIMLPVVHPSLGRERLVDVRLLQGHGIFTYDPGFTSTAACCSAITFIDGAEGICLYRGYPVSQLSKVSNYLDVCHLLFIGKLPDDEASELWHMRVMKEAMVHETFKSFMQGFNYDAHPMAILCSAMAALASFHGVSRDFLRCAENRQLQCIRLIAKFPTISAMAYKCSIGEPFVYPRADFTYAANFLRMMFETPLEPYEPDPIHVKAIDAFLILHADHEQNASTSTVRTAGSSLANPYACIAAGCASLWGPMHGGANEACVKMLEGIGTVERVDKFVEDVKNKVDGVRLMGFGHRVYKNYDPRAKVMRDLTKEVLDELGIDDPMLAIAKRLEEVALADPYFIKRKLYPNVDFYSGIMLRAIGVPMSMFTVLFAMARSIGWISQWNEMIESDQMRICRPRQLYDGPGMLDVPGYDDEDFRSSPRTLRRKSSLNIAQVTALTGQDDIDKHAKARAMKRKKQLTVQPSWIDQGQYDVKPRTNSG